VPLISNGAALRSCGRRHSGLTRTTLAGASDEAWVSINPRNTWPLLTKEYIYISLTARHVALHRVLFLTHCALPHCDCAHLALALAASHFCFSCTGTWFPPGKGCATSPFLLPAREDKQGAFLHKQAKSIVNQDYIVGPRNETRRRPYQHLPHHRKNSILGTQTEFQH
jgi:hypothetical protein